MFGTSDEVKNLMESIELGINSNVQKLSDEGSSGFENTEFINAVIQWREQDHPKKFMGGLKKVKCLFWMSDFLEDYGSKKIAKAISSPQSHNLGAGWQGVDFQNELLLYVFITSTRGFALTNKHFHLFYGTSKLTPHVSVRKLAVEDIQSIELSKSLTGFNDLVLNGEKVGCITVEEDTGTIRSLLAAIAARSPSIPVSTSTTGQTTASGESALDKIKKLKDLLDAGAISEEEFNSKKETLMSQI